MQRTKHFRVHYVASSPLELVRFTNFDWARDSIDINSTLGYLFILSHDPICCSRNKQHTISLSSTKSEYRGAMNTATQCAWLQGILEELGFAFDSPTLIWCDNKREINISTNPM